jgi:hypothetical protein
MQTHIDHREQRNRSLASCGIVHTGRLRMRKSRRAATSIPRCTISEVHLTHIVGKAAMSSAVCFHGLPGLRNGPICLLSHSSGGIRLREVPTRHRTTNLTALETLTTRSRLLDPHITLTISRCRWLYFGRTTIR